MGPEIEPLLEPPAGLHTQSLLEESLPPPLPFPYSLSLAHSLSLSQINKSLKNILKILMAIQCVCPFFITVHIQSRPSNA